MIRPRAADDFAAIRARMDELRRQRERPTEAKDSLKARMRHLRMEEIARATAVSGSFLLSVIGLSALQPPPTSGLRAAYIDGRAAPRYGAS